MKDSIKGSVRWVVLGILVLTVFAMTLMRTPDEIIDMLMDIVGGTRVISVVNHVLFLLVMMLGLIFKKARNVLYFSFIAFISLTATVVSLIYVMLPNIIIFGMFFVLILHAYLKKRLNFESKDIAGVNVFFGIVGMLFGFWYLHWVESPVWLNALTNSPLGVVNCPTMVMICGFLCMTRRPRSLELESVVAIITLYFGFFGLLRLGGVYVDISLIVCALFLLLRLGSNLSREGIFEK